MADDLPKLELAARKAFEFVQLNQGRNTGTFAEKVEGEQTGRSSRKSAAKES